MVEWTDSSVKGTWQPAWSLPKAPKELADHEKHDSLVWWLNYLAWMPSVTSGGNLPRSLWWWQHHAVGMFFSSRDWETSQDQGKDKWCNVERDPWSPERSGAGSQTWVEGSPSNRTTTLSTQPRQCRSGFGTSLWMSMSDPARSRTWTRSNISGETWK